MEKKKELKEKVKKLLSVPKKAKEGDINRDIEKKLGFFLIKKGYIKDVEEVGEDWGFVYYSGEKKICISQKGMPHEKWEQCIFKMGINKKTGENLFPNPGAETEKYRFLHEANHAYQEYLCTKESPEDPKCWYEKAIEGDVNSCYGNLFSFCFQKRAEEDASEKEEKGTVRGLSIWGNAPNYNYKEARSSILNKASEIAVRAQEDANELVTMFVWHPEYLQNYLDYLSLNHKNREVREKEITADDLRKKGFIPIKKEEGDYLKKIISSYIKEMRKDIGC